MTSALFRDGFPSAHRTTRQRIEASMDLRRLFTAIDADPALIGAGVVYIDEDFNAVTLREFQPVCRGQPIKVVLREAPQAVGAVEFKRMLEHEQRESEWVAEALKTAATCAGALLSWHVVYSGIALMPFTAGASVVVSFIGTAAVVAGLFQCVAGVNRTVNEVWDPRRNDYLDNNAWYEGMMIALDGVSLLGVGTSAVTTVKVINLSKRATGKPLKEVLRGLSRQERAKLTDELLRIQDPRMTPKLLKLKQAAGDLSKRFQATQIKPITHMHFKDVAAAGLSVASSTVSGNTRILAIGVYEEFSE
ncbi:NAD synthetase [Pseudomonas poae]|uniref:NAD synthetase n=1 Tax=Pseudomonas poae TaxID=200451 RepID=A0A2S9DV02_9PSED|nr:NAD synthetase [Pseudomonas poae]PRA21884.1 NAD synthetase [Pseudomonas poae]PRC06412.1 NAD synthetase [Pseudomonas poae]